MVVQKPDGRSGTLPLGVVLEAYMTNTIRLGSTSRPTTLNIGTVSSQYETSWALVDRPTDQAGELDVTKGDKLRLYARCAHWCFVVKDKSLECGVS